MIFQEPRGSTAQWREKHHLLMTFKLNFIVYIVVIMPIACRDIRMSDCANDRFMENLKCKPCKKKSLRRASNKCIEDTKYHFY